MLINLIQNSITTKFLLEYLVMVKKNYRINKNPKKTYWL